MIQLIGAIGTIILAFFFESPADAPLWAVLLTLLSMALVFGITLILAWKAIDFIVTTKK